ncbi:hypothetical protein BGX23_012727, partial [Mortierella sp. AD031]
STSTSIVGSFGTVIGIDVITAYMYNEQCNIYASSLVRYLEDGERAIVGVGSKYIDAASSDEPFVGGKWWPYNKVWLTDLDGYEQFLRPGYRPPFLSDMDQDVMMEEADEENEEDEEDEEEAESAAAADGGGTRRGRPILSCRFRQATTQRRESLAAGVQGGSTDRGLTVLEIINETHAWAAAHVLRFVTDRTNSKEKQYDPDPQIVLVYHLRKDQAMVENLMVIREKENYALDPIISHRPVRSIRDEFLDQFVELVIERY